MSSHPITMPSPTTSSSSEDSTQPPRTPVSPSMSAQIHHDDSATSPSGSATGSSASGGGPPKRKPSRRANTAERRATHNAVERQRRETLNGRFLDLAALLPNLSQIRRPSKSAIVNSSIAHVHASRRHRLLAARELRLLKLESDALRRELNEWRDRAGLPRVEEPLRSDAFSIVLSAELEITPAVPEEGDEECDEDGDDYLPAPPQQSQAQQSQYAGDDLESPSQMMLRHPFNPAVVSRAPVPAPPSMQRSYSARSAASSTGTHPMIATPNGGYENPAAYGDAASYGSYHASDLSEKVHHSMGAMYAGGGGHPGSYTSPSMAGIPIPGSGGQPRVATGGLYTPPSSSHGISPMSPAMH